MSSKAIQITDPGVNQKVVDLYQEIKPDIVILHSRWYDANPETKQKIQQTLRQLHRIPQVKIVLIGPPPVWERSPRLIAHALSHDEEFHERPAAAASARLPATVYRKLEDALRELAQQENATYISLIDMMCEGERCITHVNDARNSWIVVDRYHLSKAGSEFLVGKLAGELLD